MKLQVKYIQESRGRNFFFFKTRKVFSPSMDCIERD